MSLDKIGEQTQEGYTADGRTNYEALLNEAKSGKQTDFPPKAAYDRLVARLVRSKDYLFRNRVHPPEALAALHEMYVENNPEPSLRAFASVAIDAPKMASYSRWIKEHPREQSSQAEKAGGRERAFRICEYNHVAREAILAARESMSRAELTELIDTATGHSIVSYNHSVITGMSAEVAFADAVKSMPEMSEVQFTDVATDFGQQTDVLAKYNGVPVGFDLKFDKKILKKENRTVNGENIPHVTLGVPVEAIEELGASKEGVRLIHEKVAMALGMEEGS